MAKPGITLREIGLHASLPYSAQYFDHFPNKFDKVSQLNNCANTAEIRWNSAGIGGKNDNHQITFNLYKSSLTHSLALAAILSSFDARESFRNSGFSRRNFFIVVNGSRI